MKKLISLIASVAVMCSLATSAFAHTPTVTNATLDGTTVTVAEGQAFTFKVIGSAEIKKASIAKANLANLVANGWEITCDPSYVLDAEDVTPASTFSNNMLQNKWVDGNADVTGNVILQFTATPGANAKIDGVTFTWQPTIIDTDLTQHKGTTTYTLAKGTSDKVTTEDTLTDGEGVVEFTYDESYEGNKAFEGKKVVFQNVETTRGSITADTKVKVTRISTNEVKYFGEKLYANWGVEGEGELAAKTIAFGLVIDAELNAADFEFVIE